MERVTLLQLKEQVRVDADRLGQIYAQLGERSAEDTVCRAMEELAARLAHIEKLHRKSELVGLQKQVQALVPIAEQIGMPLLAHVAFDVEHAASCGDAVALAATLARLLRVGERSLYAVWDLQDLSV